MIESLTSDQFYERQRAFNNRNPPLEFVNPRIFQDLTTRKNTLINSFTNRRPINPSYFQTPILKTYQSKPELTNNQINNVESNKNLSEELEKTHDFEENVDFLRSQVFEFVKSNSDNQRNQQINEEKLRQNLIRNEIIKGVLGDIFFSFEKNGFINIQTAKSILIYLNERFKIPYTVLDIETFFTRVGKRYREMLNFDEFCKAFEIF